MTSHSTFLKFGDVDDLGLDTFTEKGHELSQFSYRIYKQCTSNGKAVGKAYGGIMHMVIKGIPKDEIIKWGTSSYSFKEGAILSFGADNATTMRVFFKNAACSYFQIKFDTTASELVLSVLEVTAEEIEVEGDPIGNRWVK